MSMLLSLRGDEQGKVKERKEYEWLKEEHDDDDDDDLR